MSVRLDAHGDIFFSGGYTGGVRGSGCDSLSQTASSSSARTLNLHGCAELKLPQPLCWPQWGYCAQALALPCSFSTSEETVGHAHRDLWPLVICKSPIVLTPHISGDCLVCLFCPFSGPNTTHAHTKDGHTWSITDRDLLLSNFQNSVRSSMLLRKP